MKIHQSLTDIITHITDSTPGQELPTLLQVKERIEAVIPEAAALDAGHAKLADENAQLYRRLGGQQPEIKRGPAAELAKRMGIR